MISQCPKGHRPTLSDDLEYVRQRVSAGTLGVYCISCDETYPLDMFAQKNALSHLEEDAIRPAIVARGAVYNGTRYGLRLKRITIPEMEWPPRSADVHVEIADDPKHRSFVLHLSLETLRTESMLWSAMADGLAVAIDGSPGEIRML